jgi:NtrC-family two-component system sensor histidine kinase KinB
MTLKKKILSGYGLACALMGLVVIWAVVNLILLGRASDAILRENYRSILAAENMLSALELQDSAVLLILSGDTARGEAQFQGGDAAFLMWLARAKDNVTIPGEAPLLKSLEADYLRHRSRLTGLSLKLARRRPGEASGHGFYRDEVFPLFSRIRRACLHLRTLNERTMYLASRRAARIATRAIWSTIIVAALALFLALVFSFVLAEKITRPLGRLMEASRRVAEGDYRVQVPVGTGDELGRLADEFNRMMAQLARYHAMNIEKIIAEKQKSEAVLNSIDDGLVVFDNDLTVTGINPAACRMLGREPAECPGRSCAEILPEAGLCESIRRSAARGFAPAGEAEEPIITLDSAEGPRHYLFSVTAVGEPDSGRPGMVLVLRDVTRLKEVERLKSEFIMAASHELRTPLTGLGMGIDLLREHAAAGLAPEDKELLQAAQEEVHRLKDLVSDLLDLSKIESGRIDLERGSVPVKILVEHVQEIFKDQLAAKNVEMTADLDEGLPPVRADANKITWVLTNLISNALRYVPPGGHIRIRASQAGPNVHLSVADDGPGIPPQYQGRIFQKFVQVEGRAGGGTGLGLAICREIVRAHGGTIWVDSAAGKGSTFTFTIPAA